jgi:hypothetical protein
MSFQHIPVKAISVTVQTQAPYQYMGFNNVSEYPIFPGNDASPPSPLAFRWTLIMDVLSQSHSSIYTRQPGVYNGYDIEVGNWIAEVNSGMCYQITSVSQKTDTSVTCVVQDVFRYNTFRDQTQLGSGGEPSAGFSYVVFDVEDTGHPIIDPKPDLVVGPAFWQNLTSRFNYLHTQYNFPLLQQNNNFAVNDVIAVDPETHSFVKASEQNYLTVGTVTSVSDTMPNWFTINPVTKVDDFIDYLPGDIGDIIYADVSNPGKLTTTVGKPVYLKLRNNKQTQIKSVINASATPGSAFQINGATITVSSPGNMTSVVADINAVSEDTGVTASIGLVDKVVEFQSGLYGSLRSLSTVDTLAKSTINGVEVTFNISQSWGDNLIIAGSDAMASAINSANIPGIVASSVLNEGLTLRNTTGGAINIVNVQADKNGVTFAGPNSASGLPLTSAASTSQCIVLTAVDSRPINLINVVANPLSQLGLVSAENAQKASGLFIGSGLRQASNTVCVDITARDTLTPLVGDQAYVINSDDGNKNYVDQWSMWLWTGSQWTLLNRQSSANVDSKTASYSVTSSTASTFNITQLTTGRRVVSVAVNVTTAFDGTPLLQLGYKIGSGGSSVASLNGLMTVDVNNLNELGTYVTDTAVKFGIGGSTGVNIDGDVTLTGSFSSGLSTVGEAIIIITYV